jgi:hypothetical protein
MSSTETSASKRIVWAIGNGVLGMIYYVAIYMYFIPQVFNYLAQQVSSNFPELTSGQVAGFALFFLGLSSAAAGLRGTIYNPILRAVSNIFGFFILIYYMNGGKLSGTVTIEGARIGLFINLSPIIYLIFAFITVPGIIIPFYEYYIKEIPET